MITNIPQYWPLYFFLIFIVSTLRIMEFFLSYRNETNRVSPSLPIPYLIYKMATFGWILMIMIESLLRGKLGPLPLVLILMVCLCFGQFIKLREVKNKGGRWTLKSYDQKFNKNNIRDPFVLGSLLELMALPLIFNAQIAFIFGITIIGPLLFLRAPKGHRMKAFIFFFFSFSLFAQDIDHRVVPNRLISSGQIKIIKLKTETTLESKIEYKVKGPLIPKKYQEGTLIQELPLKYERLEGYEELESVGREDYPKYTLTHMGRVDFGPYLDSHKVFIEPKNEKWKAYAVFSDQAPGIGWVKLQVILEQFPKWPINSEIID